MIKYLSLSILLLYSIFISSPAYGQKSDTLNYQIQKDIVIEIERIKHPLLKSTAPIIKKEIKSSYTGNPIVSIKDRLVHIPGLQILNTENFAQDARLSIRGYGARAAFGVRGIKLLLDDIPLTTPDGQSQLDNIDLQLLKSVEINKSVNSGLYGNAAGGVIALQTIDDLEEDRVALYAAIGTYGLSQQAITAANKWKDQKLLLSYNRHSYRGYRDHTESKQEIWNAKYKVLIKKNQHLKLLINFVNAPIAQDPGSLNLSDVEQNGQKAREQNLNFDAGESLTQLSTGLHYDFKINTNTAFKSSIYHVNRDFENKLPFTNNGSIDLNRSFWGHSSQFLRKINESQSLLLSYGYQSQTDNRIQYDNDESLRGELNSNQDQLYSNLNLLGTYSYYINKWHITGAIRYDRISINSKNNLGTNDTNNAIFFSKVNYQLGANYAIDNFHSLYARVATSFETPTLTELSNNPDGSTNLNNTLSPQNTLGIDIGYKLIGHRKLKIEIDGFASLSDNELNVFELESFPGRNFYQNSGSSFRMGTEVSSSWKLNQFIIFNASGAFIDARFTSDIINNDIKKSNIIPGISKFQTNLSVSYNYESLNASIISRYLGEMALTNDNSDFASPGHQLDLNISYSIKIKKLKIYPTFSINNLLNTYQYQNLRINAFGNRYYEAATPRHIRFSLASRF